MARTESPGILRRFLATLIDGIPFLALGAASFAILQLSVIKGPYIAWGWVQGILGNLYVIGCHARWGQTLGKRITGIRVVVARGGGGKGDGIPWPTAALRHVDSLVTTMASLAFGTLALLAFDWASVTALEWGPRYTRISQVETLPQWTLWIEGAWTAAEIVVLLCNPRRRALHDYIAGTVVVWARLEPEYKSNTTQRHSIGPLKTG